MEKILLTLALAFTLVCTVECKKAKKRDSPVVCLAPSQRDRPTASVEIQCKRKTSVFQLNVTASNESLCAGNQRDAGKGMSPDMIMHKNLCMWQRTCTIPFPTMKLIPSSFGQLSHVEAETMLVSGVKCVKDSGVSDVCDGKRVKRRAMKKGGMIRSHKEFPWFYEGSNLFASKNTCKKSFSLNKLKATEAFLIEVRMEGLCDTEELVLTSSKTEVTFDKDSNTRLLRYKKEDKKLDVKFSGKNDTCGCDGFIICFKVYKTQGASNDQPLHKPSVCDDLSKRISVSVKESKDGENRRGRNKKKDKQGET